MMRLDLLTDDLLGEQITYLPFEEVESLCKTNQRLHNFCLGVSTKQNNIWMNIINNAFSNVPNYEEKLLKLSNQYGCDTVCYNYSIYVNFINYLDKITQLMIYYKQKDFSSFGKNIYNNEERYIALFMLDERKQMKIYEHDVNDRSKNLFNVLLENRQPSQKDLDSVLLWSVKLGYLSVVKYLVSIGADIHTNDGEALRYASSDGELEIVKYLVSQGADIHNRVDYPLIYSSENGHLDVVKYLVENGADIHANNDQSLINAAEKGHLEIVKYLVEKGANLDNYINEALINAARNGQLEVLKYLRQKGGDIHIYNDVALKLATKNEYFQTVKYLQS